MDLKYLWVVAQEDKREVREAGEIEKKATTLESECSGKKMGSSEKLKRAVSSPTLSKVEIRSKSISGGIKVRQPRILISYDDEDHRRKAQENYTTDVKHEMPTNEGDKKLEAILNILGSLVRQTKMKEGDGNIRGEEKHKEAAAEETESEIEKANEKGKEKLDEDKEEGEMSDDSTEAEDDEEEKKKQGGGRH
ncbi:hypothetical protein CBR_g49578 [Chara braunii]|uniref:Uncharacterized protein n=1 Tax=Chara braunii TaxID=69332 RepID=A0A388M5A8_CHABU|nr:hypothetical protein CBR_g49578 [Chara braunii]|eukprot:GBG89726.1 hypothetical protein CBR_g49578 [Chara braunii]